MSTKPTCPDCGSGISIIYTGAVLIDTEDGNVVHGGVLDGFPNSWLCHECGAMDDDISGSKSLDVMGAQLSEWINEVDANAHDDLTCGHEWRLRSE